VDCGFLLYYDLLYLLNADGFTITGVCRIPGEKAWIFFFQTLYVRLNGPMIFTVRVRKLLVSYWKQVVKLIVIDYLVVGIGINVNVRTNDFPAAIAY